jgi:hypothetical protein
MKEKIIIFIIIKNIHTQIASLYSRWGPEKGLYIERDFSLIQ